MADVSSIPPAPPTQSTQPVAQQPAAPQGAIQTISTQAPLPVGSIVSGFVVNRDSSGNPILRTPSGDVTFTSGQFLKIGSEVSLRVGANASATLIAVNGEEPETPEVIVGGNLGSPQTAQTGAAQATAGPSAPAAAPTITVSGTVLSPAPAEGDAEPLPAGTQLTLTIASVNSTAAPATTAAAALASSSPAQYAAYARAAGSPPSAQNAAAAPSASQPAPAAASVLPASETVTPAATATPVIATAEAATAATASATAPAADTMQESADTAPVNAPSQPITPDTEAEQPAAASPQPGQTVAATVIASPPSGEAIVQTPLGIVQLQAGVTLPVGTSLTFEIAAITLPGEQPAIAGQAASATPAPITELAVQWTSLQQIINLLAAHSAEGGGNFATTGMPWLTTPGSAPAQVSALPQQSMSAGMMLFIQAVQGGNFSSWLGKGNTQWLEDEGHDALLKKADGEFSALSRQFTDAPAPHQWQSLFFPVAVNGEVQQARLFVKRDRKQNSGQDEDNGEDDTRFVVEVDMSQLGEMQMDGFVRKQAAGTQFDLIIRSLAPLPADMQDDIARIYNASGELTGYQGNIGFQTVREFPVTPMDEIPHAVSGMMV